MTGESGEDQRRRWKAAETARAKAARNRRGSRRTALAAGRTLGVRYIPPPADEPPEDADG